MARRSLVDYFHRFTVLGLVGLAGWGLWLTGAVYVSRIGTTERIPYGNPERETMTQATERIISTWKEFTKRQQEKKADEAKQV
ncbi:hypothetical protein Malapachy_0840 [Malassezia pachydermatis]|uniref:Uncharacterized protein n=1 Tax=Malassezia pachydermatis TaxID=77020 RepID=A0A0M8MVT4_9BASI|nr:hypothetical protein Malapachy_0840 [Malassezia pachydermatis]KOS14790.1 hypothetical protein Malapachy_0840 [Malassezia pachydermatis]